MRSWWARNLLARGTVSGGLSGFLRRGRAPVGALWGLRGVGFVVMALRPSFVGLRMPGGGGGGALLVLLVRGPVGVDAFSIVIRKGGNSQRLGLVFPPVMMLCVLCVLTDLALKDLSSG